MKPKLNKRSIVFKIQRPVFGDGDILAYGVDKEGNELTNPMMIPLDEETEQLLPDGALKAYWSGRLNKGMFEPSKPVWLNEWVFEEEE